jgi:hypothetical protein
VLPTFSVFQVIQGAVSFADGRSIWAPGASRADWIDPRGFRPTYYR